MNTNETTMTVQLSTQEVFDAGRAAQASGCASLAEFAKAAILTAAQDALGDGKQD